MPIQALRFSGTSLISWLSSRKIDTLLPAAIASHQFNTCDYLCGAGEMVTRRGKNSKKRQPRLVFDTIRKPGAPPGHPIANAKPDEKARPAGRKAKHKHRPGEAPFEETE